MEEVRCTTCNKRIYDTDGKKAKIIFNKMEIELSHAEGILTCPKCGTPNKIKI